MMMVQRVTTVGAFANYHQIFLGKRILGHEKG
jgi:hypothetical protein